MKHGIAFLMFLTLAFGAATASAQTEPVKKISGGVLNGKATNLPKPPYPAAAKAVNASGAVNVQITIDEQGNVVSASAVSGHPLLRQAAEQAARGATFSPTLLSGQPVSVTGVLVYNFVGAESWTNESVALGIAETRGLKNKITLPENFAAEQEQLDALAKLSADEQKSQISLIVSSIKSRLNPADLWRFEFGLAKGRIYGGTPDDNIALLSNLAKFRELATNKPEGIQEYEFNRSVQLAKYADKGNLTAEDKQAILGYLK